MKTILTRMKTLVENNSQIAGASTATLAYVKSVEVVYPDLLQTEMFLPSLPRIVLTPVSTVETWAASGRKQLMNVLSAYLMLQYHMREANIMGDTTRPAGQGKGIIDFVADFLTVFRSHRLAVGGTNYLDKPLDITNINYMVEQYGEKAHILIAEVTMECTRLIEQTSLPGNI